MRRAGCAVLVLGIALAACGGSSKSDEEAKRKAEKIKQAEQRPLPEVHLTDFSFEPKELHAARGVPVVFRFFNDAKRKHNFTVKILAGEAPLSVDVAAGETRGIGTGSDKAGRYKFWCKYHKSKGMTGVLVVE